MQRLGAECVCALQIWPHERLRVCKSAGGKALNAQQDSGPEVSGVTCQAKEITDQPEAALVSGHQPAKHTVNT